MSALRFERYLQHACGSFNLSSLQARLLAQSDGPHLTISVPGATNNQFYILAPRDRCSRTTVGVTPKRATDASAAALPRGSVSKSLETSNVLDNMLAEGAKEWRGEGEDQGVESPSKSRLEPVHAGAGPLVDAGF